MGDVAALINAAIDGDGSVLFNCVSSAGKYCVTKHAASGAPPIILIDQSQNWCYGDFPSFITGGGVVSFSAYSDDPTT